MTIIYPGSFDPITFGHLDIMLRASLLFDGLVVAVFDNPSKKGLFTAQERAGLIESCTGSFDCNIEVEVISGLLANYAAGKDNGMIIRGLRSPCDFETEYRYASYNRSLSEGVETLFIPCSPAFSHISSSIVKEAAKLAFARGPECSALDQWVPEVCKEALKQKFMKG